MTYANDPASPSPLVAPTGIGPFLALNGTRELDVYPGDQTVLLIDDELDSIEPILRYFEGQAWRVLTACDEQEAVMEIERHRPSLIFVDLVLERESGLEILRHIRDADPGARVVMISRYFDMELIKQSLRCGAVGFIQKASPGQLPAGFTALVEGAIAAT